MAKKSRFLLLGWDAADWKIINPLLDKGELPHLESLINRGVMGNLQTLKPVLSPMLWSSIATGKRADQHGILGFKEVEKETGRIIPSLSTSRKCKALWNMTTQSDLKTNVVSWFAGHPAEPINGVNVTEMIAKNVPRTPGGAWETPSHTVHPPEMEDRIKEWRLRPEELDADVIKHFVPLLAKVDQSKDPRISNLSRQLAEAFTIHGATLDLLDSTDWDFMASYYISIDHFCHAFMPFHPPKMDNLDEGLYEIYNDVINSVYRLHDLFLGRILESLTEDDYLMLVSDHGFLSDHERPTSNLKVPTGPADWHRDQGIFCFAGPGIAEDERIDGAGLLDITPTVLHALNLPVGKDMEGKVLTACWKEPQEVAYINSWEEVEGEDGSHTAGESKMDLEDADALLQNFIDLGYIDKPSEDNNVNVAVTQLELDWSLAEVYREKQDLKKALPLLESCYQKAVEVYKLQLKNKTSISVNPENMEETIQVGIAKSRPDIVLSLANAYLHVGALDQAREILSPFTASAHTSEEGKKIKNLSALVTSGKIELAAGNPEEALEHFTKAKESLGKRAPLVSQSLGNCYKKLRKPTEAIECYQEALRWDSANYLAAHEIATVYLAENNYEEAVEYALQSISINFQFALAHQTLGRALMFLKSENERAELAFKTAIHLMPSLWTAHEDLAALYLKEGKEEAASFHQQEAGRLRVEQSRQKKEVLAELKDNLFPEEEDLGSQGNYPVTPSQIGREYVIVSGIPRSGTSLMMGMLNAGGQAIMSDGERAADSGNPTGYFEWEAVKKLREKPELLEEAYGKAFKVVSPLLTTLPAYHRYKVIFMIRDLEEVSNSQNKLLDFMGKAVPTGTFREKQEEIMKQHRERTLWLLHESQRHEVLELHFSDLIKDPEKHVKEVSDFLEKELDLAAMMAFVNPDLYRQKS